jgi:hypothetical protein
MSKVCGERRKLHCIKLEGNEMEGESGGCLVLSVEIGAVCIG